MEEVNNPERLAKAGSYDTSKYDELLAKVYEDAAGMAGSYGIKIVDESTFKKNIEYLFIAVKDNNEEVTFLKDLVKMATSLRNGDYWKIAGLHIESSRILRSKHIIEGMVAGLMKELEAFIWAEREDNRLVDGILIGQLKSYLKGKEISYPKGHLNNGTPYYISVEQYLLESIDFSYQDNGREYAAQALASCFLGKKPFHIDSTGLIEDGWNISVKEGAFIYDLLHYCGYISDEQYEDKNLEIYPDKAKYDMVKPYFS